MIQLNKICFFYNEKKHIFTDLDLCLDTNKKYWLQGKNGSGKTTLLHILLGVLKVKKGTCILNYEKNKTLFIPSTTFFEPYMKLYDFLYFYLNKMLKIPNKYIDLEYILNTLNLSNHKYTLCKNLSKGTQQKIIISPLFTKYNWKYLFMDEPFEHLDTETCYLLKEKIHSIDSFIIIINHKEHILNDLKQLERIFI